MDDYQIIIAVVVSILMLMLLGCAFFGFRIWLVSSIRERAIDAVYDRPDWRVARLIYSQGPDYDAMIYDLRKWSFKQFYPTLTTKEPDGATNTE